MSGPVKAQARHGRAVFVMRVTEDARSLGSGSSWRAKRRRFVAPAFCEPLASKPLGAVVQFNDRRVVLLGRVRVAFPAQEPLALVESTIVVAGRGVRAASHGLIVGDVVRDTLEGEGVAQGDARVGFGAELVPNIHGGGEAGNDHVRKRTFEVLAQYHPVAEVQLLAAGAAERRVVD